MSFPSTWWFKVSQRIWQPGSLTDRFCQTAIWQLGWRSVWCPGFLTQMSAIPSTHPILTEDRSWFFLAKYPQYGQLLLLRNSRLLLSHVASWRLDGGYFFFCLATIHRTQLIPTGIAATMAARHPAGMCMCRFLDGCEEECHFTGQSGVGH